MNPTTILFWKSVKANNPFLSGDQSKDGMELVSFFEITGTTEL